MESDKVRMRMVFACLGVISVMTQVILMRRLMSAFSGNELTIGAALAGWMIWTGLGSACLGRASDRIRRPGSALGLVFLSAGIILPGTVMITYTIKPWLGYSHAEIVGVDVIILASFIVTAPLCFALGFAFNLCSRMVEEARAAIGRVYLWEALGSALAGAAFSFLIAGRVPVFRQAHLVMAVLFAASALCMRAGLFRKLMLSVLFISVLAIGIPGDRGLGRVARSLRWGEHNLLFLEESRYGELAVTESGGEVTFYTDGVPAFTHPLPEPAEYIAHLPLSMCENPDRILVIGGGLAGLANEIMKYEFERLDYIQIDPDLTRLEERFIPGMDSLVSDPRVSIRHEDGRRYLKLSDSLYDAVILNLGDPETAQVNRFYTEEFFRLVKSRLNPGGVFGLTAGTSGNYVSDAQALLLGTIHKSLKQVFEKAVILPLGVNYLVAGVAPAIITDDPEIITKSLRRKGIQASFAREYFLEADLSLERLDFIRDRLASVKGLPVNLDLKPRGYLLGMALWLEQAQPFYRGLIELLMDLPAWGIFLIPVIFLAAGVPLASRLKGRVAAVAAVGSSGFVTMAAEVVVIISFQVIHGYVYHLLGLIVAVFMVGLAAGAWSWGRAARRSGTDPVFSARLFIGCLAVFSILPLVLIRAVPFLMSHQFSGSATLLVLSLILFLAALASGFLFSSSAALFLSGPGEVGRAAGWINSSDHFGAALGAFTVSALAIPLFGIPVSLALAFFILAASLVIGLFGLKDIIRKGN